MDYEFIQIYCACTDKQEALNISRILLEKRLIACVNIFPVEKVFLKDGRVEEDKEYKVIFKTHREKFDAIKKEVAPRSAAMSEVLEVPITKGNKAYFNWITECFQEESLKS